MAKSSCLVFRHCIGEAPAKMNHSIKMRNDKFGCGDASSRVNVKFETLRKRLLEKIAPSASSKREDGTLGIYSRFFLFINWSLTSSRRVCIKFRTKANQFSCRWH